MIRSGHKLRNAVVRRLNDAITGLYLEHHERVGVTELYRRWCAFLHSTAYRTASDAVLFAVYREFAGAYRIVAHILQMKRIDPTLAQIGARNATLSTLDRALERVSGNVARGQAELSGEGGSAAEQLNNAIMALDWAMPADPPGRKRATSDLAVSWLGFWRNRSWSPLVDAAKLQRYAEWYACAWTLADPATRKRVPDPLEIDATDGRAIRDQIRATTDSLEAAAKAGGTALEVVDQVARKIGHGAAIALAPLAVLIVAVLVAFGFARSPRAM